MKKTDLIAACEEAKAMIATWPLWKQLSVEEHLINSPLRREARLQMATNDVSFEIHAETASKYVSVLNMYAAIAALQIDIHAENVAAGWWTDPATGEDLRDPKHLKTILGWKLLLAHSEISEAAEGLRKDLNDDKLPHRSMMEVEIADTIIRLLDLAEANKLDVAGALREKRAYNAQRQDHKPENRAKAGGKQF